MAKASIDAIRSVSRAKLYSVTAHRALWLKPWSANTMSKQTWCKIPFDGKLFFGRGQLRNFRKVWELDPGFYSKVRSKTLDSSHNFCVLSPAPDTYLVTRMH